MKKLFWPFISYLFFFVVMGLWFGAGFTERRLSTELAVIVQHNIWLSYDVKGDDVVLRGIAPNADEKDKVTEAVKSLKGIDKIVTEIIVPEHVTTYHTEIMMTDNSITLRGNIPPDFDRFAYINKIEEAKPGLMVYDELEQANGAPEGFVTFMDYLVNVVAEIKQGNLSLNATTLITDQAALETINRLGNLPSGLKLQQSQ